jgi:hypothetical protein
MFITNSEERKTPDDIEGQDALAGSDGRGSVRIHTTPTFAIVGSAECRGREE